MRKDYIVQDGCWNCKHIFVLCECDENDLFYCTQGKTKRPLCNSHYLGESFNNKCKKLNDIQYGKELSRLMLIWSKWAQKHSVQQSGICHAFVKKEMKNCL